MSAKRHLMTPPEKPKPIPEQDPARQLKAIKDEIFNLQLKLLGQHDPEKREHIKQRLVTLRKNLEDLSADFSFLSAL